MSKFSNLKELDLSGNNIREIPKSLYCLRNLERLSLNSNKIEEIFDDIEALNLLKIFDLRFNQIDKISKKILDLNLKEFWLEGNPFLILQDFEQVAEVKTRLKKIYEIHEHYTNYRELKLSGLKIVNIPNLSQFSNLESLDLSDNNIKLKNYTVQDEENFKRLTKLKKISLKKNDILDIPEYLTKMTTLEVLDLSSNNIEKIPKSLLNLTNLTKLNIANNPVSQLKGFPLKKSPKEIIEFLLFNQDQEKVLLNEAKLLVVGDENSGKTSLVERMVKNKFTPEYNSTKGIDISQYPLSLDIVRSYCFGSYIEPNIKVNIWDFAGQEITYQVHNLFMSKESLYLLVIDGQKEDNIVENFDWLETISANADNPPIIIVVTKY